ncbi:hypothetical protein [Kribbella solani]|uniref:Uncharacterized protein n=1 Tax=Kribbella solani TaxID=236067 RepID=A0A841DNX4_9ACTN|nr:hypothetical protein [Kribbella solani]MBB5980363.1 hypothetical protein [Kribbella solani]
MSEQDEYHVVNPVVVCTDGVETTWSLDRRADQESQWTLVLAAPDGSAWTEAVQGLWNTFLDLRRQIEPLGYRLCCAGARIDAIMRKARDRNNDEVYLLTRRTLLGVQHRAWMFDYAPPNTTGTVEQQEARYDRYLGTRWWRALLPGDPVG